MVESINPQPGAVELGDISLSWHEVYSVVDSFYSKVALDDKLSVPFASVDDWPHHVNRLTHFWWVRLGGKPYLQLTYNPVLRHYESGFTLSLLERWLGLFRETVYSKLEAEKAEAWLSLAQKMGAFLNQQNEVLKKRGQNFQK